MFLRRIFFALVLFAAQAGAATPPELAVAQAPPGGAPQINLTELMSSHSVPLSQDANPDVLWQGESGEVVAPSSQWRVSAGERMTGRITLLGSRERDTYVIQVPIAAIDEVQVWYRPQGGAWRGATAGDRVALSRWPFAGQFPAFPVPVRENPVDVIVTVVNDGPMRLPVWIMADPAYREYQIRQSNLSGLIMGLGVMVAVVCTIGAFMLRRRANVMLAVFTVWNLVTVMCLNGYMAVWFTPEWPAFNDASKHFSGVMLAGLMVSLTAEALDQRYLSRAEKSLKWLAPLMALVYGAAQISWLPPDWRPPGALIFGTGSLAACVVLCALSALHGGRYVRWIGGAVACFALAVTLVYARFSIFTVLDVRAAGVGLLLYSAALLFRQAIFSRERYGRDVLGRAAVAASRDPLTALLSYQGFQQAWDEALLKQGAGEGRTSMILFLLPGLEKISVDHGFVLTERVIVSFAACLQSVLGDAWSISRLSKTRFACIGTGLGNPVELQTLATHVLAQCTRMGESLGPAAELELKIVCVQRRLGAAGLKAMLFEMEEAARTLEPPKRIVTV